jgi:hypothetical protein
MRFAMKKLLAILFFSPFVFAQAKVVLNQVNDRRTSSGTFSELTISLELQGVKASEVAGSRVVVTKAIDDSGKSLIDTEARPPEMEPRGRMGMGPDDGPPMPATVSVTLKNPDRKATKLKEVRGDIELFIPSKDPNSVAEVAKFMSYSGKPLPHKALAANGVEIAIISPAQLGAEKKKLGDAKRIEAKASGLEGADLDSYVASYLENVLKVEDDEVLVRIKDPNKRLQQLTYITASGESKQVSKHDDEGLTRLSTWGEKPAADWKLRVSMTSPKNVVKQSFALTDVPLP